MNKYYWLSLFLFIGVHTSWYSWLLIFLLSNNFDDICSCLYKVRIIEQCFLAYWCLDNNRAVYWCSGRSNDTVFFDGQVFPMAFLRIDVPIIVITCNCFVLVLELAHILLWVPHNAYVFFLMISVSCHCNKQLNSPGARRGQTSWKAKEF